MSDKITIDLNKPFLNLDNEPHKLNAKDTQTLGKLLGSVLANFNKGNAIKYTDWALDLWRGRTIQVDEADKKELLKFIQDNEGLTNLMKAQMEKAVTESSELNVVE